jgi:hypothetical protein
MPSTQTRVRSPWTAARAFDYLADLEHFAEWDPGTIRAERVPSTEPGAPPAYDVTVETFGREVTLRYEVVECDPPRHLRLVAESSTLRLVDEITVTEEGDGCIVTYDAALTLRGPLVLLGPLFAPGFRRTVARGADGLTRVLDGVPA